MPNTETPLLDHDVTKLGTIHLLNLWFAIMSGNGFGTYLKASPDERAEFYRRVCREIDRRIPIPGDPP